MKQTDCIPMNHLKTGETGIVVRMNITGAMRRRLQDIGLIEGTKIRCEKISPLGDPSAFRIRGALIALRDENSSQIEVIPWD